MKLRLFVQKRFIIAGVVVTTVALIAASLIVFDCDPNWVFPATFVASALMTLFLLSERE